MQNNDIVRALETIATLMEIKDEAYYRVLGYQRAAESVAALGRPVTEVDDLKTLPHVGATTAEVIRDLAEDRTPQLLADLTAEIPEGLVEITRLPSVGPRTVGRLWKELGVTNVEELAAMDPERISSLKGFGKKSAEKMVQAARTYNATERRMLLDEATSLGEQILSFVRSHPATERAEVGGSLRRMKETIGDIDIVAASEDPASLADDFAEAPFAEEVLAHGPKKVFILMRRDRGRPEDRRARGLRHAACTTSPGGQAHNIALRERAVKMGINISEYGLASAGTGDYKPVATEEDLYSRLGLAYIPPELREDTGEIEAADSGKLPDLVSVEDVRGDLHVHTNYSDGKGTIESMAEAAIELGYEYLVFCDHSQSLRVANGLSPERLKEKLEAVRKADEGYEEIHLLCGSEVDILRDGSLDYDDEVLADAGLRRGKRAHLFRGRREGHDRAHRAGDEQPLRADYRPPHGPHPEPQGTLRGGRVAPYQGGRRHEHGPRAQRLRRPPRPRGSLRPRGRGGGRQHHHRHGCPRRAGSWLHEVRRLAGEAGLGREGECDQLPPLRRVRKVPEEREVALP